jgi:hypothetical protein
MTMMRLKSPRASLQLTHGLRGYIRQMHSCAPTGKIENKNQHQAFSIEHVSESLTSPPPLGSGATDEGPD